MYPLYVMYVIDFSVMSVKYPKWLEDTMFVTLYDKDIEDSIRYQVNESPQYIEQLRQKGYILRLKQDSTEFVMTTSYPLNKILH